MTQNLCVPSNVRLCYMTIKEIEILATKKFGIPTKIEYPYKLCDYKPAYGLLFEEILTGYDFWAQTDIDVIFGEIRAFLDSKTLLNDYIGVRHDYTAGCFFACRNNDRMKTIFMQSKDFIKVFSTSKHYCFDECNFEHQALRDGMSIFDLNCEIESYTYIIRSAERNGLIKAHFDFMIIEGLTGKIKFDRGKLIFRNTWEAMLYHLYYFKDMALIKHKSSTVPDSYRISKTRIY